MGLTDYIGALPFDTGSFARDDQGLAVLAAVLEDARAAGEESVVIRLERQKANLTKVLEIKRHLQEDHTDLTIYEYQDDFSRLLIPFGETGGTDSGAGSTRFVARAKVPQFSSTEFIRTSTSARGVRNQTSNRPEIECVGISNVSSDDAVRKLLVDTRCVSHCRLFMDRPAPYFHERNQWWVTWEYQSIGGAADLNKLQSICEDYRSGALRFAQDAISINVEQTP